MIDFSQSVLSQTSQKVVSLVQRAVRQVEGASRQSSSNSALMPVGQECSLPTENRNPQRMGGSPSPCHLTLCYHRPDYGRFLPNSLQIASTLIYMSKRNSIPRVPKWSLLRLHEDGGHWVMSNPCFPKDHSPPGSSVHWIFQARILEWHYQRNANQNLNEVPLHASQDGCYPKVYKQQMLERVWRKGNPLTLLVGMQTSTAAVENSVEIP